MTATPIDLAAVVRSVTVPQQPAAAFRLFTADLGRWWPRQTHSVGGRDATDVTFGAGVGQVITETIAGGAEELWGTITAWEPPGRVAFTWHPGTPVDEATAVEVTFTASERGTVVTLTHTGWERRPDAQRARTGYKTGWVLVLGKYASWVSG